MCQQRLTIGLKTPEKRLTVGANVLASIEAGKVQAEGAALGHDKADLPAIGRPVEVDRRAVFAVIHGADRAWTVAGKDQAGRAPVAADRRDMCAVGRPCGELKEAPVVAERA